MLSGSWMAAAHLGPDRREILVVRRAHALGGVLERAVLPAAISRGHIGGRGFAGRAVERDADLAGGRSGSADDGDGLLLDAQSELAAHAGLVLVGFAAFGAVFDEDPVAVERVDRGDSMGGRLRGLRRSEGAEEGAQEEAGATEGMAEALEDGGRGARVPEVASLDRRSVPSGRCTFVPHHPRTSTTTPKVDVVRRR